MRAAVFIILALLAGCAELPPAGVNVQWCPEKIPGADGRLLKIECRFLAPDALLDI